MGREESCITILVNAVSVFFKSISQSICAIVENKPFKKYPFSLLCFAFSQTVFLGIISLIKKVF